MFKLDDFRCTGNSQCPDFNIVKEYFYDSTEPPVCKLCGNPIEKVISSNRTTHSSWSAWRAGES